MAEPFIVSVLTSPGDASCWAYSMDEETEGHRESVA